MKVACVGNMNNNFFALVRFLRDRGVDAHLLLLVDESEQFYPENDTFTDHFKEYTKQLSWGMPRKILLTPSKQIREDLKDFDFIIACGTSLAYIEKAGIKIDIFSPHGSDLRERPFISKRIFTMHFLRSIFHLPLVYYQRKAIKNASCINTDYMHPLVIPYLLKLSILDKAYLFRLPMVYTGIYTPDKIKLHYQRSKWYPQFLKLRQEYDILIFHGSRHVWTNKNDALALKANDNLIKGLAKFLSDNPKVTACIIAFEYGHDVEASKKLSNDLNIEDNIKWFPVLSRKDIMVGLSLSDIGTGHFDVGFVGGGTLMECMAMGKPLLHYRNDEAYSQEARFPMINVKTADDICNAFQNYLTNPQEFEKIGADGAVWYENTLVDKCVSKFIELIRIKEQGGDISEKIKLWRRNTVPVDS